MNVNVGGKRPGYRLVNSGGRTLIDSSTKLGSSNSGY